MHQVRLRRSLLFMPGLNARAIQKGRTLPCDGIIIDLEDAVAPEAKLSARDLVVAELLQGGFGRREIVIRVNAPASEWFADDVRAAAQAGADAILVPKIGTADDIAGVGRFLDELASPLKIWAMIETPRAVLHAEAIASMGSKVAGGRLEVLVAGTNDLSKEILRSLETDRGALSVYLSLIVAAARAHGLDVLDGVFNRFGDPQGLRSECEAGKRLGFDGKTLIHPVQIEDANEVFAPDPEALDKARRIVAAFERPENRSAGAISLDGEMVERLHAETASRLLEFDRLIRQTDTRRRPRSEPAGT